LAPNYKDGYRDIALAAITGMREMTRAMHDAGVRCDSTLRNKWYAMIDEALQ